MYRDAEAASSATPDIAFEIHVAMCAEELQNATDSSKPDCRQKANTAVSLMHQRQQSTNTICHEIHALQLRS